MMKPWVVERIRDESGKVFYRAESSELGSPIKEQTAEGLRILMRDTVVNGTCRKSFVVLRRKKAFRDIEMGAKTGTINDAQDRYKYDWLTAYALPGSEKSPICLAIVAVHGEKLGIRSRELAKYILAKHFGS